MTAQEVSLALSAVVFKVLPLTISVLALELTLRDRRPRLVLKSRKSSAHRVYRLHRTTNGIAFVGGVEVYNMSGRANAIRDYSFFYRDDEKRWKVMESQNYEEKSEDGSVEQRNPTQVALAPYSGTEVKVLALTDNNLKSKLDVRIELEDLFGKHYSIEVSAEF
jgi:hypothetical protein